jgi:hypothetical protein
MLTVNSRLSEQRMRPWRSKLRKYEFTPFTLRVDNRKSPTPRPLDKCMRYRHSQVLEIVFHNIQHSHAAKLFPTDGMDYLKAPRAILSNCKQELFMYTIRLRRIRTFIHYGSSDSIFHIFLQYLVNKLKFSIASCYLCFALWDIGFDSAVSRLPVPNK